MKKFFKFPSFRFLAGGAANTLITYIIYLILLQFISYKLSYTVTYIAGIVIGYLINAIWVFQSRPSKKTAIIYPFVYLTQYLLGIGLLIVLVDYLSMDERFAPILVILVTLPLMYLMTRLLFQNANRHAYTNN